MPNTFKINTPKPNVENKISTPKRKSKRGGFVSNSLMKFISGDYLFSNNLWRSPIWFIMYVVFLILILVGIRSIPVKKYNEIITLREELKELRVRNYKQQAEIEAKTSAEILLRDFIKDETVNYHDIMHSPIIIKIDNEKYGKYKNR